MTSRRTWDVIVIGAGPAGAVAAHQCASRGARTLLVERAAFPRPKVCGGCLSAAGVAALRRARLDEVLATADATLDSLILSCHARRATLNLRGGLVVRRDHFDAELVRRAADAGAQFMDCVSAQVGPTDRDTRTVTLRRNGHDEPARARCVIHAAGLHARIPILPSRTHRAARIGLGAIAPPQPADRGVVHMTLHSRGYLGTTPVRGGLIVAGAVDPRAMRTSSPEAFIQRMRESADLPPIEGLTAVKGTPRLTHKRPAVAERLFVIGDAAAYVEPFTGEGMTWAIESALAAAPLAVRAADEWTNDLADRYRRWRRSHLSSRMAACRLIARALRAPNLAFTAAAALGAAPRAADAVLHRIHGRPGIES